MPGDERRREDIKKKASIHRRGKMNKNRSPHHRGMATVSLCVVILFMYCHPLPSPVPSPYPVPIPVPLPMEIPYLWAIYTIGDDIFLKETTTVGSSAVFNDDHSTARHALLDATAPVSRPSAAFHQNSQWVAWKAGNTIYAKAIWWGPAATRIIYDGGANPVTGPAIVSYQNRLVAVWGRGNSLYFSTSEYGVQWTSPVGKAFAGSVVNTPAAAVHGNKLFVGAVFGPSLFTIRINDNWTWGPNFRALSLGETPLPAVSLASNNFQLSLGYTVGNSVRVIHSSDGCTNWSAPRVIESGPLCSAPPALCYFNDHLYAVYPTTARFLMKRSPDGNNWATPRFVVDAAASGALPAAAVIPSRYTIVPPTPAVHVLNNSGRPASSTFNLVIVSEGYTESEMAGFRNVAAIAKNTFTASNPLPKHLDKFNMYRIDIPSREKGANASPNMAAAVQLGIWNGSTYQAPIPGFKPRYTDTALGSRYLGNWDAPHPGGLCMGEEEGGIHSRITMQKALFLDTDYAYDLVEHHIPGFDRTRDVLYAIIDVVPDDGGTEKRSYNPMFTTADFAQGLTYVHELGHFMGGLSDEDFEDCPGGAATDCMASANKTINDNLHDPAHKWAHYFTFEDRPGASILADPVSRPPTRDNFWDPAEINGNDIFNVGLWASCGITDWAGTGGDIVYAPVQQCLMNHTGGTTHFCPVCAEEMTKALFERTGDTFVDSDYHDTYGRVYVEYMHRSDPLWDAGWSKTGFISVNGIMVPETQFTGTRIGRDGSRNELCRVNITPYLVLGTNTLAFHPQPGIARTLDLLALQVVNGNGAPLHLYPVTDLSFLGTAEYFCDFIWPNQTGDLIFEFSSNIAGP
jgi:hypothetical protein